MKLPENDSAQPGRQPSELRRRAFLTIAVGPERSSAHREQVRRWLPVASAIAGHPHHLDTYGGDVVCGVYRYPSLPITQQALGLTKRLPRMRVKSSRKVRLCTSRDEGKRMAALYRPPLLGEPHSRLNRGTQRLSVIRLLARRGRIRIYRTTAAARWYVTVI
jgi:hypothetical protein